MSSWAPTHAIQTCFPLKILSVMLLRQTTGTVQSQLWLVGLDWAVPDFQYVMSSPTHFGRELTLARQHWCRRWADSGKVYGNHKLAKDLKEVVAEQTLELHLLKKGMTGPSRQISVQSPAGQWMGANTNEVPRI